LLWLVQTSLIKALLGIERGEDSERNRALVVGLASDRREPVEVDIGACHVACGRAATCWGALGDGDDDDDVVVQTRRW
jgi:hypothetical protein